MDEDEDWCGDDCPACRDDIDPEFAAQMQALAAAAPSEPTMTFEEGIEWLLSL